MKKCDQCERHGYIHNAPLLEFHSLISPWTFSQWGVDILILFPLTLSELNFLIVAEDYFTKWVKAGALAMINVVNFLMLFKINILIRYGIP